ncbi:tumor protein p53-inducible nuclear protein 1 [Erpetoichthys calabaricus]|uniref:Tumor protein p53 inducible nuclear protein 1 n=1 Tax=Erpetoichthys calabaricus TaxID=27687 RepID=A0A8C4XEB3_ERPCA|nr:tumor protein p53-inducible nuclear protein 1 [Erpetoichthys calabaricus]
MFQKFTSCLFGEPAYTNGANTEPDLSEKEEEDDWILVDLDGHTKTFTEDACEKDLSSFEHDTPLTSSSSSQEVPGDTGDLVFLQLDCCALEESWFITPPPCFTAGGHAPVLVEMSPMENLLIEHPSMSVYAVHSLRNGLKEATRRSTEKSILRLGGLPRMGEHIGCYAAAIATHTSLQEAKHTRLALRAKENVQRQRLTRSSLRRQNLAKECPSRANKQGGFFIQQPCQRQFNY